MKRQIILSSVLIAMITFSGCGSNDNKVIDSNSNSEEAVNQAYEQDTLNSSTKTSLEYMETHKNEKLASTDCKVRDFQDWKDAKNEAMYTLAPADNMMKSIEGCIGVTKLTEYGNLSFSKAVESVVRSRTKETSPFSDVWDTTATATPSLTVEEVENAQNNHQSDASNNTKGTLTLEKCKTKYGEYSASEWANAQGYGDNKAEAMACYQAIVVAPSMDMDGQPYIDAYNNGTYDVVPENNNETDSSGKK